MHSTAPDDSPPARFDFNKAAKKFTEDFPRFRDRTIFVDLSTKKRNGPLLARIRAVLSGNFRRHLKKAQEKADTVKRGDAHAAQENGLYAITMTTDRPFNFVKGDPARQAEMDHNFTFHHEAAHLVVPAGHAAIRGEYFGKLFGIPPSLSEGAADAYAVIRHLQEYGAGSAAVDYTPLRRALSSIQEDAPEYMTTFIIDAVLRDRGSFAGLSPNAVVERTQAYAMRYTPSREQSEEMRRAFLPLKGKIMLSSRENDAPMKLLADIALDPAASPFTFYIGNRIIGAMLGKMLNGKEWEGIAARLHAKEKTVTLDTLFSATQRVPAHDSQKHNLPLVR